jgi:hypothetical protein
MAFFFNKQILETEILPFFSSIFKEKENLFSTSLLQRMKKKLEKNKFLLSLLI